MSILCVCVCVLGDVCVLGEVEERGLVGVGE